MHFGISVIICCYNSAWVIARTLEGLKKQSFSSPIPYEIILVDNCCTDNTVEIAKDTMRDSGIEFQIIKEQKPGLVYARRRGIREAKYGYTIYCDDDNILCPTYVSTMANILATKPDVGAAGGKGVAEFCAEPAEIVNENLGCYAIGSQLENEDWLFGAGLAVRTDVVRNIYDNQRCYMMGRQGQKLLSGDDSELVMSIVLRGYRIFATDEITFTHVLKAERLTEEYFHRLHKGLMLPQPAFSVMRAAMKGTEFKDAISYYLYFTKRYIKYSILWWKPNAKNKRNVAYKEIEPFIYWGIPKLYVIYRQWVNLKKKNSRTLTLL